MTTAHTKLVPVGSPLASNVVPAARESHLGVGDLDSADGQLAEAVDMAEGSGAAASGALALAERAVVAIDRGEWTQAELLAEQARSVVQHAHCPVAVIRR